MTTESELRLIRQQCSQLIQFLREAGGGDSMDELDKELEYAYSRRDKRDLGMLLRDLTAWVSGLTSDGRSIVKSILDQVVERQKEQIKLIFKHGTIRNEEEFELVSLFVEQNFSDLTKKKEVEVANVLLVKYYSLGKI